MKDQYGRPVFLGDTVTLKGQITDIIENPNYINCTVRLDQPMPPSGAPFSLFLNTAQLVKDGPADPPDVWPIPMTPSRLEAIHTERQAAILAIYLNLGEIKLMAERLAALQKMQTA